MEAVSYGKSKVLVNELGFGRYMQFSTETRSLVVKENWKSRAAHWMSIIQAHLSVRTLEFFSLFIIVTNGNRHVGRWPAAEKHVTWIRTSWTNAKRVRPVFLCSTGTFFCCRHYGLCLTLFDIIREPYKQSMSEETRANIGRHVTGQMGSERDRKNNFSGMKKHGLTMIIS